jgi:exodeoxyribonuclease V alpha subunit
MENTIQLDLFAVHAAEVSGQPAPMSVEGAIDTLRAWVAQGWLRRLDLALATFVANMAPDIASAAVVAIALTAHLEGQGHSCLVLDELLGDPDRLLGWKPEAMDALHTLLGCLPAEAAAWRDALRACPVVRCDPQDQNFSQPLVLAGLSLYLRRYWRYEQRVSAQVRRRTQLIAHTDENEAKRWLDLVFAPGSSDGSSTESTVDWQKVACAIALHSRLAIITGGPGTGKTYTAARLLTLLFAMSADRGRLRVALAAPTGKAAARLQQSIEGALQALSDQLGDRLRLDLLFARIGAATTLHSLLGARPDTRQFKFNASKPLDVDVLFVDEASMVHVEMMASLLEALPEGARLVLLGDKDQLASVEAGSVLSDLCRNAERGGYNAATVQYVEATTGQVIPEERRSGHGSELQQCTVMLRRSQRFGGAIGTLAAAVNAGDVKSVQELLSERDEPDLQWLPKARPAAVVELAVGGSTGSPQGYRSYLELLRRRPTKQRGEDSERRHNEWATQVLAAFDSFRVLCAVREGEWGVAGMNRAIEIALADRGLISRRAEWYEGRPVMLTRNDATLGVFNGDVGIVLPAPSTEGRVGTLRAYFANASKVRSVAISRLVGVETAFAMTVHKSQGSEFDHVVVAMPSNAAAVSRELLYTGITRARSRLSIVSPGEQDAATAASRATSRSGGLGNLIHDT